MKLSDHVEDIRQLIDTTVRNRLGRMGITEYAIQSIDSIPDVFRSERRRIEPIREVLIAETGTVADAYEKIVEEFTFTFFNRIAALKVIEAHTLHPEIITRRSQHGDRSFAHKNWLEQNPGGRNEEMEGIVRFMEDILASLGTEIPLFSPEHPYHLLPTAIELNAIINAFNAVETDEQVGADIWKSDDVLGWLYESYNNHKKANHKDSGEKTEYNKVSIQSQVYTPRWVVKFLVDNSLGKLYLEMYPDSDIKHRYKIANAPKTQTRIPRQITEIKLIDPATGSGNFLLYGFDLFYDLYIDQIENYGADYNENKIQELIIEHNLYGVDLDDRAVQLAQLGLYIKAKRKKRTTKIDHFNVVSSDFFLPAYEHVQSIFEENTNLDLKEKEIIHDIWADLQQAYKFGSLIRLEEKLSIRLHGLTQGGISLFSTLEASNYQQFRDNFFTNLQKAISQNTARQGQTFLNTKTQDAITFLQLISQKYDVAVANPPYTDCGDFGPELKKFVETNYRQPYKFNTNLYAVFIKRCCELTEESGFVALIHPHTFMFIKSFEDVRKYIIENTNIDILVDYGLDRVNLFGPGILLDATWYVLSKKQKETEGIYFNITANQQERVKQSSLEIAYDDALNNRRNNRVYSLAQSKLKIIEGWPFIYWISDGFREKFKGEVVDDYFYICNGISSGGNNERFYRYLWEVSRDDISLDYKIDRKKWVRINKGGGFNKWFGNLWLLFEWAENGKQLKELKKTVTSIRYGYEEFYFEEGLAFTGASSKGLSVRYQPKNCIFERAGKSIFKKNKNVSYLYVLAFLNSSLCSYIIDALNPTVSFQSGDIERIPLIFTEKNIESIICTLSDKNVTQKEKLCSYKIVELNFTVNPLFFYSNASLRERIINYLDYENLILSEILINEAVINRLIFEIYELNDDDKKQIDEKIGKSIGELPVMDIARKSFLAETKFGQEIVRNHINTLVNVDFEISQIQAIKSEFNSLYQSNNDLEEFCIRHQVNPINVWYWFKESKVLPQARAGEIALEFLADGFRTILMNDEDGIVPLVGLPGEPSLMDRFEEYCFSKGFTAAQVMQLDGLLGHSLNDFIEHHFFKNLSDHLNLFMYLPKTPFIWHLSSGEHQGFEAYIIIYKWNRDSLYKLRSTYLSKRSESLNYRLQQIKESTTGQAQTEKETIRLQLQEIDVFAKKIDELIAEGYDPKLDDGVGKNIAPLQKKVMLRAEVLKSTQLQKYLNADW
ncbi:MAG: BREX-1 system adenine-specific DNA-methyltransferase PglX [Bacteroidales bacterium]|jgi:hypothetical protein